MSPNSTQQEILIMTGTTFSSKQWCEKDDPEKNEQLTELEKLQEAGWNGLLQEMLPEIFGPVAGKKGLFLWQISEAGSFIELDLGEFPVTKDKYFSINPYCFLGLQSYN